MGGWWSQTREEDFPPEEATSLRTHHPTDSQGELRDVSPQGKPTDYQDVSHHTSMPVVPSLEELMKNVPPEKFNQPCADEYLCEIALSVTKWQSVAPFLGLTEAEEEEIKKDCTETSTQRIKMLRRWRQKFGSRATYRKLAEVFNGLGQAVLVEKVCELLQDSESSGEFFDAEESLPAPIPPGQPPDEDVQEQQVAPCEPENPVLAAYARYLRERYQTENPAFLILQWPPPPTCKVFNLAMILQKTVRYGPDDEFVRLTLRGNVDDIMERKTPVNVKEIFKLDRKAHKDIDKCKKEKRKLILIEGAPGAGKSTLAWHIPQKWARGELFQEFKVVAFIQLRDPEVQAARSLADLLPAENRPAAEKMASELCTLRGRNSLFILDSWDEFSPQLQPGSVFEQLICYPHKLNLHLSAVLITSRPIASGVLYQHVSSRVEIVGFTPTERRQYFKEVLKGDYQKLQDCLSERPVIEASCYLPLNAAIVAHLFLALNQTLPNTLREVFSSLVICCLVRHMKKVGITAKMSSLENIPPDIQQPLKNICTLAYHGVMENKATFSASDLQSFDLPTELSTLSLIQGVESFTVFEETKSYSFLHLSIQELLAALHISKLPESEQIRIFKELFGQSRFAAVFQYYATFTMLQAEGIQDVLVNIVKGGDTPLLVSLLHCLYEAQDLSLCQFVASQLNRELNLGRTSLSPVDCLAVGYFLRRVCLTTSGEFKVDLSDCSLDDYSVSFLVRGLSKPSSSSDALSVAATDGGVPGCLDLDLSGNAIHGRGAKWIAELLSQCSLIRKLNLDSNELQEGEDGLHHLLQALLTNSSLVDLSLLQCSLTITEDHGPVIAQMLQTNKTLKTLYLSQNNVSGVGAFYLAEGLKQNTELKDLSVSVCGIRSKGAQFLSEALIVNTSLVTLDISVNDLGDDGVAHISHSLTLNTTLRALDLNGCKLTEKGSDLLAQALNVNKSLRVLDIERNPISDTGATHIADVLRHNQSLKKLNVNECGITDRGVESLATALTVNSNLEELDMDYNQFTDTGATHIADALRHNQSLIKLSVRLCGITDRGVESLATALTVNSNLEELNLNYNQITDTGATNIADVLRHNQSLKKLSVRLCGITDRGVESLATALTVNSNLEELNLNYNQITDTGATNIADVLRHNQSLKKLSVRLCRITDRGVESLATALTVNSTLEELILNDNQITDTGLLTLGDCLKNNKGLQTLWLRDLNQVTAEGLKQFVQCRQENCHLTKLVVWDTAGGPETVRHETELVNEKRRQRNLPELVVTG